MKAFARPNDAWHAKAYLVVRVSALKSKLGEIVRLVPEVLTETVFEVKQTGDLIKQCRRAIERGTMGIGGRVFAARRAMASQSVRGAMEEAFSGIDYLQRVQDIDESFGAEGAEFCRRLSGLAARIFVRGALTACFSDNIATDWLEGLFMKFPQGGGNSRFIHSTVPCAARRFPYGGTNRIGSESLVSERLFGKWSRGGEDALA